MGSHHGLWLESEDGAQLSEVPADTADGLPIVHELRDEVGTSVRIQILRAPADVPVSDVAVEIRQRVGQGHAATARTDETGTADLDAQSLPVGTYDVKLVFPDGDQYQLFDERNRPVPAQIRLHPAESTPRVLRIKRDWLVVRVVRGEGHVTNEICGARVQLRQPRAEQETNGKALAEFSDIPVQTPDLTAHVEALVPDGDEGAWEVVEVSAE
jgi:hypothetical protein